MGHDCGTCEDTGIVEDCPSYLRTGNAVVDGAVTELVPCPDCKLGVGESGA